MTTSRIMSARCEVALMKPITGAAGRTLDHHLEALTHQRLAFQETDEPGRSWPNMSASQRPSRYGVTRRSLVTFLTPRAEAAARSAMRRSRGEWT